MLIIPTPRVNTASSLIVWAYSMRVNFLSYQALFLCSWRSSSRSPLVKQTVMVWVDLEKAFDRVWTKGLLLKLLKTKITHKMYNWIKQYIHNRKAAVCLKGKYNRTASFEQGVPQGGSGVLSPSLFLIFLNDLISTTSPNVKAVQYADDLALICSEDSLILAQKRLQTTLNRLDQWTTESVYESKCHKNNLHGL